VDQLRAAGLQPVPVVIHGGDAVSRDQHSGAYRVPKRELVGCVAVLLQTDPSRLLVEDVLQNAKTLQAELLTFKAKISSTGHDSYEAWRERDHDDLVLATALGCWYGDHQAGTPIFADHIFDHHIAKEPLAPNGFAPITRGWALYTIDRAAPFIRQWVYSPITNPPASWRMSVETGASSWLANHNREAFNQDHERLTSDFAIFSLVSFFGPTEFDWQLKTKMYRGKVSGDFFEAHHVSTPRQCTVFREEDLRSRLTVAGDLFQGAPIMLTGGELCLPPQTTLEISAQSVVLRNPICEILFVVDVPGAVRYGKPKTQPTTHEEQYETRVLGFDVKTTFFALRAQHRDSAKYHNWGFTDNRECAGVVRGANLLGRSTEIWNGLEPIPKPVGMKYCGLQDHDASARISRSQHARRHRLAMMCSARYAASPPTPSTKPERRVWR
jgi:hypothetical protein